MTSLFAEGGRGRGGGGVQARSTIRKLHLKMTVKQPVCDILAGTVRLYSNVSGYLDMKCYGRRLLMHT